MTVRFELPKPVAPQGPIEDARGQLARLYREIGITAVASALYMDRLPSVEEREAAALSSHEIPPMLRKENLAA